MDLLTQAIVGAVAGGATLLARRSEDSGADRRGALRAAALTGALAAMLADADVLLGNPADPIVAQELHRHFTHALLFVPIGAALMTALLAWPMRAHLPRGPRFAAAFAGLLTAGLLDACTGFGTHLLWPFSDARIAWNLLSIIDPVFTLLALVPLALALRSGRRGALVLALALMAGYLMTAAVQQQRALTAGAATAAARGEIAQRLLVRPSFGNILLWRSLYLVDGHWQADALRLGPLTVCIHPGSRAPALQLTDAQERNSAPPMAGPEQGPSRVSTPAWLSPEAARRLSRLTDDTIVIDPAGQWLGDARFAMLPDSMTPIWGLRADPEAGPEALEWFTDRSLTPVMRTRFLTMLLGTDHDC